MKLILNPKYILKHDKSRTLLMTRDIVRALPGNRVESVIHPIHGMILACFDGKEYMEAVNDASIKLGIPNEQIQRFVTPLINNKEPFEVEFENKYLYFPENVFIEGEKKEMPYFYSIDEFGYDDICLKFGRHQTVTDITLMITTNCATNCIYCYADRKKVSNHLPIERVKELIDEAVNLRVRSFDILGGDIFAYPFWKELISYLYKKNYLPYISTKVPLLEDDIRFLKDVGVKDIQISLDTLIPEKLAKITGTNREYKNRILKTLKCLEQYSITTTIHTVVCHINETIEDLESIYNVLCSLNNINKWRIDPADYSMPKGEKKFKNYKPKRETLKKLQEYILTLNTNFDILSGGIIIPDSPIEKSIEDKKREFLDTNDRSLCTANHNHMFILPDGQVTICEQLYWHPKFIIGDVTKNNLLEIWNSDKAINLYFIKQNEISKSSACYKCETFNECRFELGGVCWKDIIKCYGDENWDFPDPRCYKAPKINSNLYL